MKLRRFTIGFFFVLSVFSNDLGCSSNSHQGTIEILISDHRDAIDDFSSFEVELRSIELHRAGEPIETGWLELQPLRPLVDLTEVIGEDSVLAIRQTIPAGSYDAIRINASDVRGILLDGEEVALGSFSEAARQEVTLADGQTATLLVELKVQSRNDHPGQGYMLVLGNVTRIP